MNHSDDPNLHSALGKWDKIKFLDDAQVQQSMIARCLFWLRFASFVVIASEKSCGPFSISELDKDVLNFPYLEEYLSSDVVGVHDG